MARISKDEQEIVKKKIISVSRKLFNDVGFDKTSTKMISKEAGIAEGTIFNYFGTKDEIFFEVFYKDYIDDIESNEILIESLIDQGIYNIILADTVDSLKEEIEKVVSDMGISKREIKLKLSRMKGIVNSYMPEYSFNNKSTSIIITGASTKVGTTTMAINLCNYLSSIGARACYVEANANNHINELPKSYSDMTVKEDSIIYYEVKYLTLNSNSDDEYNFVIYDMGVIEHKIINVIKHKCDVAILCATTKPYEIETYDKAINILDDANFYTIFSFVEEMAKSKLSNKYREIFFPKYTPNPFDGEKNINIWEQILDKYITKNTM